MGFFFLGLRIHLTPPKHASGYSQLSLNVKEFVRMFVNPCDGLVQDVTTMTLTIILLLFSFSQGMLIEGPPGPEGPTVSIKVNL